MNIMSLCTMEAAWEHKISSALSLRNSAERDTLLNLFTKSFANLDVHKVSKPGKYVWMLMGVGGKIPFDEAAFLRERLQNDEAFLIKSKGKNHCLSIKECNFPFANHVVIVIPGAYAEVIRTKFPEAEGWQI